MNSRLFLRCSGAFKGGKDSILTKLTKEKVIVHTFLFYCVSLSDIYLNLYLPYMM